MKPVGREALRLVGVVLLVDAVFVVAYFLAKWFSLKSLFPRRRQWLGDVASKSLVLVRTKA